MANRDELGGGRISTVDIVGFWWSDWRSRLVGGGCCRPFVGGEGGGEGIAVFVLVVEETSIESICEAGPFELASSAICLFQEVYGKSNIDAIGV